MLINLRKHTNRKTYVVVFTCSVFAFVLFEFVFFTNFIKSWQSQLEIYSNAPRIPPSLQAAWQRNNKYISFIQQLVAKTNLDSFKNKAKSCPNRQKIEPKPAKMDQDLALQHQIDTNSMLEVARIDLEVVQVRILEPQIDQKS